MHNQQEAGVVAGCDERAPEPRAPLLRTDLPGAHRTDIGLPYW
jgi:hypothetical protein